MVIANRIKKVNMPEGGGVFTLLKQANEVETKIGKEKVIKSVIGSLFDENENFFVLPVVEKTYKNLSGKELFNYSSGITGSNEYKDAVKKNFFGPVLNDFDNSFVSVIATAGGSGALHNTFKGLMDDGQTILIPDICWESYDVIASANGLKIENYSLFNGNAFDIEGLKEKATQLIKKEGKVLILINSPCHNPTGYSLTDEEWVKVADLLREISVFGDVILVNDVAYIDYDFRGELQAKQYLKSFVGLPKNVLTIIAFSISKALTSYGLRLGAQIAISSSQEVINDFNKSADVLCRSTWSNVSNGGMSLFVKLHTESESQLKKEVGEMIDLLKVRSDNFMTEAKAVGLDVLPFRSGFFVTIPVEKNVLDKAFDKLKENNVFVLKLPEGFRIALCSMTKEKCKQLPKMIKDAIS